MTTTQCIYTEPTAVGLESSAICRNSLYLAAFLGSKSAQTVVGCTNLEGALAEINPRVIGNVIQGFDSNRQITRRIALIIAKHALPAWQNRFRGERLGDEVVSTIARIVRYGPSQQEYDRINAQIGDGRFGGAHESTPLSSMLKLANDSEQALLFGEIMSALKLSPEQIISLLAKELIPWLLGGREVSPV